MYKIYSGLIDKIWNYLFPKLEVGVSLAIFIVCSALFIIVITLSAVFSRKYPRPLVIISSLLCSILVIPIFSSLNNLMILNTPQTPLVDVDAIILENQRLKMENEELEESLVLARNSNPVLTSYTEKLEVSLTELEFRQTDVRKELIPKELQTRGVFFKNNPNRDQEVLVISTHDITANYGIDFQSVRVKQDNDTVTVGNIKPISTGITRNETTDVLAEIRNLRYKQGTVKAYSIADDFKDYKLAQEYKAMFDKEFQRRFDQGLELGFVDKVIRKLGESFIRDILNPVAGGRTIQFVEEDLPDGISIMEYIQQQNRNRKIK